MSPEKNCRCYGSFPNAVLEGTVLLFIFIRFINTCHCFRVLTAGLFQMEEDLETDGGEGATNCHVGDRDLEDDINVSLEELPHQSPPSLEDGASVRYSKIAVNLFRPNLLT
jgi:hypothetical protein